MPASTNIIVAQIVALGLGAKYKATKTGISKTLSKLRRLGKFSIIISLQAIDSAYGSTMRRLIVWMKQVVNLLCERGTDTFHSLQVFYPGSFDLLKPTELLQDLLPSLGPKPCNIF